MYQLLHTRLNQLHGSENARLLKQGRKGIEKESLRVTPTGLIAQTPHPAALGAALTHPYITTDYSEALLEFVTPAVSSLDEAQQFLSDIHQFVYHNIPANEYLWATSMPCVVKGDATVPLAWYGDSNAGMMKHVYRRGLGYRYGRVMQTISGVHFNYSLPEDFWPLYQQQTQNDDLLQTFISASYFGLLRNVLRYQWLIFYLFGSSPAVCKSFVTSGGGRAEDFHEMAGHSFYKPYATTLRMSDVGYTNKSPSLYKVSYNSLEAYIDSLNYALATPHPEYAEIGVEVDGEYRQLNDRILQIANEYYSAIRPKRIPLDNEQPTLALQRRGVQYVELRALDVDPFDPTGVNAHQLHFLEAFLLFCLLHESPPMREAEHAEMRYNKRATADNGREPTLMLQRQGEEVLLRQWGHEILDAMTGVCDVLDSSNGSRAYSEALAAQTTKIHAAERTPSARILAEMEQNHESFVTFASRKSKEHARYYRQRSLDAEKAAKFEQWAHASHQQQTALEMADTLSFEAYLRQYYEGQRKRKA